MVKPSQTTAARNGNEVGRPIGRLALIGNFLPRRCGIATYTTDTYQALRDRFPDLAVDVYAMNDRGRTYDYPPAVVGQIEHDSIAGYLEAARAIEASGADIIWLQHEYGIFGGAAGDHILKLLDRVSAPVIVTLHTVLDRPSADERRVLDALIARATRLVVMADRGREILQDVYGASPRQIAVIPHGIPDRPLTDPDAGKAAFGIEGRRVILTFGLLSPNKGIETMIAAMPAIVERFPDTLYVVLGATHPHLIAHEGEAYRERLMAQARDLGVADNIRWENRFVEAGELLDYIAAADIYVTPYLNPAQVTSGTLAYAVGLGKPVIATPYVHASELLGDGHGVLVNFGDSESMAAAAIELFADDEAREALRQRAYALGRTMIWPRLAERAHTIFEAVVRAQPRRISSETAEPIPEVAEFRGVERLTDGTGMLQHSFFSVPDRAHGYCVDDNARALMLMSQATHLDDDRYNRLTSTYAAFVHAAWNPATSRFRNFMAYDRTWLEDSGSEDSCGRTLWALGVVARDGRRAENRRWASALFDQVAGHAFALGSPRARAFCMLAGIAMLEAHPGHGLATRMIETFGDEIMRLLAVARRPDWAWFEAVLAYDNCRLPEALIRAGTLLRKQDYLSCGIETLEWMCEQQTSPAGHFQAVGSESFGRPHAPPLPFDQQPLEAWATIDACEAALVGTGDPRWRDEAVRAYRWFIGDNDLAVRIADPSTGECYDGLTPAGVNQNRGAESVLAFHFATIGINRLLKESKQGQYLRLAAE